MSAVVINAYSNIPHCVLGATLVAGGGVEYAGVPANGYVLSCVFGMYAHADAISQCRQCMYKHTFFSQACLFWLSTLM